MALLPTYRGYTPAAYVRGGATPRVASAIQQQGVIPAQIPFGYNPSAYVPGFASPQVSSAIQAAGAYNPAAYVRGGATPAVAAATQAAGYGFGQPFSAPTIPSAVAPAAAAAAPARRSLTASQVANQQVNTILNPQLAAQAAAARGQSTAIQNFAKALMGKLTPLAGQVGQAWQDAASTQAALGQQAAGFLQQANPTPQVQALLQSVNAPQAQQQQLAGQLGQAFGGGAAVLNYLGGAVPAGQFATDRAAAVTQAAQYPALAAMRGQQDLANALYTQQQARNQIEATRGQLYTDALQTIHQNQAARATAQATAAYRAAELGLGAQRITEQGQAARLRATTTAATTAATTAERAREFGITSGERSREFVAAEADKATAARQRGARDFIDRYIQLKKLGMDTTKLEHDYQHQLTLENQGKQRLAQGQQRLAISQQQANTAASRAQTAAAQGAQRIAIERMRAQNASQQKPFHFTYRGGAWVYDPTTRTTTQLRAPAALATTATGGLSPSQLSSLGKQIKDWHVGVSHTSSAGQTTTDTTGTKTYADALQNAIARAPSTPAGAAAATRLMNAEYFGVSTADPNVLALKIARGDKSGGVGLTDSIRGYLTHLQAGNTTIPHPVAIRAIAKAYGVQPAAVTALMQQVAQTPAPAGG